MEKEKNLAEDSSGTREEVGTPGDPRINELDRDWNDYLEEILYYGLESWGGG